MSFFNRSKRKDETKQQPSSLTSVDPTTLRFGVGDIVRDVWGNEHIVTEIDPTAEHGVDPCLSLSPFRATSPYEH
jgi:hypothetical protein